MGTLRSTFSSPPRLSNSLLKIGTFGVLSPITVIFVVVPEVVTGTKLSSVVTKLCLKEMKMS